MMDKNCKNCGESFRIATDDLEFYEKLKVPAPTRCPKCRQQRRLAFRNDRSLYKRTCGLCGKAIVTLYSDDVKFPVYCAGCWWSDKWSPFSYGRDFDLERPFFGQLKELMDTVPKMACLQLDNENSEYNALLAYSKNTYMSPGSYFVEDCYYCRKSQYCRDCLDCNFIDHCELVKSSVNCSGCYNCYELLNCRNCRDCAYMADSTGCSNCFMCSGIVKGQYFYKNIRYPQREYENIVKEKRQQADEILMKEFWEFNKTVPKKALNIINCEACSGDYLQNCKNALECYDCFDLEDCKYLQESVSVKDSMDLSMHDKNIELGYELCSGGESNTLLRFSFCTIDSYDSDYLFMCFHLKESFGCDGFHSKNKFCILNKQYSGKDYVALREKIIEHMKKTGEYGEFFPIELSPFPYNESCAQDYFPMIEEDVLAKGWRWKAKDRREYASATAKLPAKIEDVPDVIINTIMACEKCGKNYKILKQELSLCRKLRISLSRLCADCRMWKLNSMKNPRKLWDRKCAQCAASINTTYAPDRPEIVYCEKCYLELL